MSRGTNAFLLSNSLKEIAPSSAVCWNFRSLSYAQTSRIFPPDCNLLRTSWAVTRFGADISHLLLLRVLQEIRTSQLPLPGSLPRRLRIRRRRVVVPPVPPLRHQRPQIHPQLLNRRAAHIPPAVINLEDRALRVEHKRIGDRDPGVMGVGRVHDV